MVKELKLELSFNVTYDIPMIYLMKIAINKK
jgi:hypothetical protein